MKRDDKQSIASLVRNIIHAYFDKISDLFQLVNLEAKLAIKTLSTIIMLIFIVLLITASTWIFALLVLFYFLISLNFSSIAAASIVTGLGF